MSRGYFGIGVCQPKTEANVGTLMRSAFCFGAAWVFTIGARYKPQVTDTPHTTSHVPLFHFNTAEEFLEHGRPGPDCPLVGVEITDESEDLPAFRHPERCIYLLGSEDRGLSRDALNLCDKVVRINTRYSLNVAVAGSLVLYDRHAKTEGRQRHE